MQKKTTLFGKTLPISPPEVATPTASPLRDNAGTNVPISYNTLIETVTGLISCIPSH